MADLLMLAWCVLWVSLGIWVTHSFSGAEDGARHISTGSTSLSTNLEDAGTYVAQIPLAGGALKAPFDHASSAAASISSAGSGLADGLAHLAIILGCLTALLPVVLGLMPWLFLRLRFARRAGRLHRLRQLPGGARLLALEGLTLASPSQLAEISSDPVTDWQAGHVDVTRRLADVALSSQGLRWE